MHKRWSVNLGKMNRAAAWGLATTLAVATLATLSFWVLDPLNERGVVQPVTSLLSALNRVLQLPGLVVLYRYNLGFIFHPNLNTWFRGLVLNLGIWFILPFLLYYLWHWPGRVLSNPPSAAPTMSRRAWLKSTVRVASIVPGIGALYGLAAEPRWFGVTHRVFRIRDLPPALDGLRIAQITDVHHGPWLPLGHVHEIVRAVNRLAPDLVVLTGDYVDQSPVYIEPVAAVLGRLRPRIGTLAVLGNHDWGEGAEATQRAFCRAGLPLIDNSRRVLTPDRRLVNTADIGLALCGIGDFWCDRPDYRAALDGLPSTMPRLLLSHNPDAAEDPKFIRSELRVDLMLSGHTHGGQIRLPGLGPLVLPSKYGQKYAEGLVQGPCCPVFVCRGLGMSAFPVRFNAPPEVAMLELRTA
jgi:predicted MPP superfamily phosphohydrolase